MTSSLFFNHITPNSLNNEFITDIEKYGVDNPLEQIYLINSPLGENKYNYQYANNVVIILSPKHKIIFVDMLGNEDAFDDFYEDFMEDVNSISSKYNYQKYIGRVRKWKDDFTVKMEFTNKIDVEMLFKENSVQVVDYRKCELLISLITGSINDIDKVGVETPTTLLEKIKHNIILFDGEQTRFIYQKLQQKTISIQGLSGTGKTELLMHKLKEIYTSEENTKIFFTCHNIALANTLKHRIPEFFDFMRVEKQIKWNTQLWVDRAWGARADKNSGLYSYICDFYEIPFLSWSGSINYEVIFSKALEFINKLPTFEYAFDYILIDEKQDFPEVFFKLCEKITRFQVYIAGDIFQDIFQNNIKKEVQNVDYVLNRCYRTAPRILMFAHSIGMGLFENVKLNWLEDNEWISSGYKIKREGEKVTLTRESIRRFEELEEKNIHNMNVQQFVGEDQVIDIIEKIKNEHPTVEPSDIAVIMLDKSNDIYQFIDLLEYKIVSKFGWTVNKAFETKQKTTDQLFISNVNNVKGLEFPFVICITNKIRNNYSYRNSLYTMLTRAFLQSYLLINNYENVDCQIKGLDTINKLDCIETIEPSVEEKELIQRSIIKVKPTSSISFYDFMNEIFKEQNIDKKFRTKFIQALPEIYKEDFDRDGIIQFIQDNRKYYCL